MRLQLFKTKEYSLVGGETAEKERQLVRRLDRRLLVFAMLGYFLKVLDSSNLGSAYISGMEEELQVKGIEYNWMTVYFTLGYLTMQVPSNAILSRVRPSQYLPCLELLWCVLTFSMAGVRNVNDVYVIRVLLGLAEAGFYPGTVFLIGSWYTKAELGKRSSLFIMSGSLGGCVSGMLQAFLLKTMNGTLGLSGWRWLFIFDGFITIILAAVGFFLLPDYPTNTTWLSEEERALAIDRLEREGKTTRPASFSWKLLRRMFGTWHLYVFVCTWICLHTSTGAIWQLGLVAKKLGYDSVSANLFTTPNTFFHMICILANGYISDHLHNRMWCLVIPALFGIIGYILLAAFVQPFGALYVGFLLVTLGTGSESPVVMTWVNEILNDNMEARGLTIAAMNAMSGVMSAWLPLFMWPVTDAPYFHTGFIVALFFVFAFIGCALTINHLHTRDMRLKSLRHEAEMTDEAGEYDKHPLLLNMGLNGSSIVLAGTARKSVDVGVELVTVGTEDEDEEVEMEDEVKELMR